MSVTYLMSYPGPDWQIRGGANFRSLSRTPTSPRAALKEWLSLCDSITRAGGHILVMAPPTSGPPLTGLMYTANAGQLFRVGEQSIYLLSNMTVPHRQPEREVVREFATLAGLSVQIAEHAWEGQADLQLIGGNRFIATWGVRTVRGSVDDLRPLLPLNAKLLDFQLVEPFFHGDVCLNALVNRAGDVVLLAHPGAFATVGIEAVRQFVGNAVEVLVVDSDDALAYACNALSVNGTVLMPEGVSANLRGQLVRRGFTIEELALPELFGKGGGGPRCLVNELRGLVIRPGAPDYASCREDLVGRIDQYPEELAVAVPPAVPADASDTKPDLPHPSKG